MMAEPATSSIEIVVEGEAKDAVRVDPDTGTVETDLPDGSVVVQLDAHRRSDDEDGDDFYRNLALDPGLESKLSIIAEDLIQSIQADDNSRADVLAIEARGLDLLGIKLQEPSSGSSDMAAPMEGMSSVTNPLLLEACLRSWANAVGELLPATGPVKIKDDGEETAAEDDLADALERDMNHWFTKTASEYYPDTSHMLLWGTHFKGSGFKKIYRCPMQRRPVSKSVPIKDLIVSDTETDLRSCARITHQISMRPSVMKRMQMIGAYRDVTLTQPSVQTNVVIQAVAGIQGTSPSQQRPEDQPYTLWEAQCELDLPEFAPKEYGDNGVPIPFLVTIDKDSHQILALRRDWREDDDQCERRRMYVRYPYIPGPGFYGTGLLNILGNSTAAMTAAWREALDAGMFANFPGFLIAKLGGRQNTSDLRVGPAQGLPIETGGLPISHIIANLPYHDVTPGLMALMDKIIAQSQKVGGTADLPISEGIANVPVGTMLAQIEQATKVMAASHKGMHTAQSEEIELIVDLFREQPEDFWRANKICKKGFWNEEKFLQAIDNCNLVPVSDPNVPSHIHRVMKVVAWIQLAESPVFGPLIDKKEVLLRVGRAMREDTQGIVIDPPPQNAAPDPKAIEAHAKILKAQTDAQVAQGKLQALPQELAIKAAELKSKENIAASNIVKEKIIHQRDGIQAAHDMETDRQKQGLETVKAMTDIAQQSHEQNLGVAQHAHEVDQAQHDRLMDHKQHALDEYEMKHPPRNR